MAAIGIWLLGFLSYGVYLWYVFFYITKRPPTDIYLIIGVVSLIVGFIAFAVQRKFLVIASFLIMFGGVALTYPIAVRREDIWPFVGALAAILFFGTLSMRTR